MDKIKLALAAGAIILGGLAAWYVQGLRADNARLGAELSSAQALSEAQAGNLGHLAQASTVIAAKSQQTQASIAALNRELQQARQEGKENAENNVNAGVLLLADQLNRLFGDGK
jgi:small-conductance mechanosensitive channel